MTEMTHAEWMAKGTELFGSDQMNWKFVCPCCGFIQTAEDYKAAGASSDAVAFSCVGRWAGSKREALGAKGKGPCNYAGGGLFRLNPVLVDGKHQVFAFAEGKL